MAATAEAICNLALGHLGNPGTVSDISSPTSSIETHCSRWYAYARDMLLAVPPGWKFARRRVLLVIHDSSDEDADLEEEWAYAFTLPTGQLRVLNVSIEGTPHFQPSEDFDLYTESDGTTLLLTDLDLDESYAEIMYQVTDPTKFSNDFDIALSYLLASFLAGPIVKGDKGIKLSDALYKKYEFFRRDAQARDKQQQQLSEEYKNHKAPWIGDH